MKIVQLTPGAGEDFYCENCLRESLLAQALRQCGHDAVIVPMYLPPILDDPSQRLDRPVFFGGINVYLQQKSALFRRTPRWLDRLFDASVLLRWAGRLSGMTRAKDLGETLLSMLRGEHGRQVKELRRLVAWLKEQEKPDVVVLASVMLSGLAREIRRELGVPVLCSMQDEDAFVDALPAPYSAEAWALLRQRSADVDAFVASSRYYARTMQRRLDLPADRVHVAHGGLDPAHYAPADQPPDTPTIGYLSVMSRDKGLDLLLDAFERIKADSDGELRSARLRIAGGTIGSQRSFVADIRRRVARSGFAADVEFLPNLSRPEKALFLRGLSVMSVPTRQPEAFGQFILEALACGVPVVQPRHGGFVEIVEATGGGVLHEPNDVDALTDALRLMLLDREAAGRMARLGRQAVAEKFSLRRMGEAMATVIETVVDAAPAGRAPSAG